MANPDYEFLDGFDIYGPANANTASSVSVVQRLLTRWTSCNVNGIYLKTALSGTGQSIFAYYPGGSGAVLLKTLPGNYPRILGGVTVKSNLGGPVGVVYKDASTAQVSVRLNTSGQIEVVRGDLNSATILGTSAENVVSNSVNYICWDITISPSAGIVKVWLNNVLTTINLTGQNTRASANSYVNAAGVGVADNGSSQGNFDHYFFWGYTAAGGSELPPLDSPIIQTDFPSADSAVASTPVAGVLGGTGAFIGTSTTSAPGANKIVLRPYVAEIGGTLNSVAIMPAATSAGAKLKPVVYANSAGIPGSLLTTGAEVIGTTSGTLINMPVTTPQTLVAATTYWIGYITDTSVALSLVDDGTAGYNAANTYTSGAPGSAPAMTGAQPSYLIYGAVTGLAANFAQVNEDPALGLSSYNSSSTVSAEDLYTFPNLAINATAIYTVAVSAYMARSDTGARTANLRCKSVSTSSNGSNAGQSPPTSFSWLSSNFKVDPNTGAAWANAAAVNAAKYGDQVAS